MLNQLIVLHQVSSYGNNLSTVGGNGVEGQVKDQTERRRGPRHEAYPEGPPMGNGKVSFRTGQGGVKVKRHPPLWH